MSRLQSYLEAVTKSFHPDKRIDFILEYILTKSDDGEYEKVHNFLRDLIPEKNLSEAKKYMK